MLAQEAGRKILLLRGGWADRQWISILHLTGGAAWCLMGNIVKEGTLLRWDVNPPARKTDVVSANHSPHRSLRPFRRMRIRSAPARDQNGGSDFPRAGSVR